MATYAKACADYEFFRGIGLVVCLVKRGNGFFCDLFPGGQTILRVGGEAWEEVRGRTQRVVDVAEMPIRLQRRDSFVRALKSRREVLGQ